LEDLLLEINHFISLIPGDSQKAFCAERPSLEEPHKTPFSRITLIFLMDYTLNTSSCIRGRNLQEAFRSKKL
jgi:hypothetical protein